MRNKLLAILIGMATLLGSAMPIFADSSATRLSDFSFRLRMDKASYVVPDSATDLTVPIYMQVTSSDFPIGQYYSGYAFMNTSGAYANIFGVDTSAPVNVYFHYFEPVNDHIFIQSLPTASNTNFTLAFDNFLFESGYTLIGYNHYSMDSQHNVFTFTFPNISASYTPASMAIYRCDYEFGFYNTCKKAVSDALDANQSIYEIVHNLQDIYQEMSQSNQAFLTWFQTTNQTLDDIDRLLGLILTQNQNLNQTLRQFYDLYYGVVHASKDASNIQQDVDEKAQVSASLAAGMAMDRPELDAQDVNINEMIDQEVNTKFGIAVGSIFSNNFIVTMMMISVSAMIIGFVLYGKK